MNVAKINASEYFWIKQFAYVGTMISGVRSDQKIPGPCAQLVNYSWENEFRLGEKAGKNTNTFLVSFQKSTEFT